MTGLQHLIDFVLNEVALCGDQGATLPYVLNTIDDFYSSQTQYGDAKHNNDPRFKAKIWAWLVNNPEVSVGPNNEWNHLTLEQAEEIHSQSADSNASEDQESNPNHAESIRMFVSGERTWLAVAGHPPDESKVVPLEFALLSIIASHKSRGITQPDLVKMSGQDKRSVPKRTDALQRKGYIDKRPIQTKSARTSLCTLRRFLHTATESSDQPQEQEYQPAAEGAKPTAMIDFDSFNNQLFGILREHGIIARDDLKRKMGFKDRWRWKVLSRAIRKWERIGVLKRVRAESQYEKLHPCVKLERDPTPTDLELFHEFNFEVLSKHGVEKAGAAIPVGTAQGAHLESSLKKSPTPGEGDMDLIKEEGDNALDKAEPARRVVPSWTPDRNLNNQIFDLINETGTTGITNMKLMRACFGNFFKRPAENLVHRLVDLWQVAQPLHLRHFALVRDTAMKKTVMFYVHYSANNFAKIVEQGRATWEAVEFPADRAKKLKLNVPPFGAVPNLDNDGFPADELPRGLMKNPNSSLRDGITAAKPADYTLSSSDPFVVKLPDGQYAVRRRHDKLPAETKKTQIRRKPQGRPKGRPSAAELAKRARESEARGEKESGSKDLPLEQTSVEAHDLEELEETPPPPKRMKRKSEALIGLSKKEKLEALGLDENWTEYNALVMNKPTPGVYITPQGRRRPVGKSRGRPRISRIAIFKSPKLSTFAWFVKDEGDSDNEDPEDGAIITPRESVAPSIADPDPLGITPSLRNPSPIKRAHPNQNTPTPPSPYSASSTNDANSERPSKRPRLNMAKTESIEESLGIAHQTSSEAGTFATHDIATPRNRDKSLSVHMVEDEQTPTPSKRRRVESGSVIEDKTPNKPSPPPHPFARTGAVSRKKTDIRVSDRTKTPKQPTLSRRIPRGLRGKSLTEQEQQLLAAPKPLIERGGSISVLRRKVIMEIMDKANGSYPGGSLIWYPFVTRWMNMGHKQKPDMKTVRNTVKQLVDAGHLRQLTFCGKDKKGLTVTKTLLIKSDVDPESPSVETMKKRFLAMDPNEPRPEFCENVEVDQLLTRSSGRPHGEPPRRQKFSFPVEKGAHFNLHQKPAYIVNEESRRSRQIQRSYRKHIATEARIEARIAAAAKEELEIPGVQRLMTLSRPPTLNDRTSTKTSIMRPRIRVKTRESHQPQNPIIRANRLMKPISTIGSYAMLMKPPQHFHMATGTFSTGSCSLKSKRGRKPKLIVKANKGVKIQTSSVDDAVIELSRLAHDGKDPLKAPETPKDHSFETFCSRADKISEWEIDREPLFDEDLEDQPYINQTVEEIFETAPIEGNICFVTDMPPPPPRTPAKLSPQKRSESRRKRESVPEPPKDETPKRKSKQRRIGRTTLNRRLAKLDEPSAVAPVPEKDVQQAPRQRFRRQRSLRNLPDQLARKLMVALVAVRVLAGGAESRVIDWHLVTLAFPDYEPSFIEGRARQVLNKNRLQMIKMQRDFQDRFLEAYAKDEVPSIDYSDLESYDWPALVEWANVNLDVFTSQQVPELPATREQFDSVFQLREEPATAGDQLYQAVHGVTINHKRDLMARNPFAIPLEYQPSPKLTQRREELAQLENAKSWVRANIITPEITYKPNEATDILALFGESLLREATQALMNERVICSINRRDSPDRNYDISENFLQALSRKRGIDSTQLRRAISFKSTILDSEIKQTGSSEVKYNAEDGDILALINLHASGHIKLHPQDAPRDKFGLTDGGYLTRQMDKRRLRFPVKIVPTGKYIHGNPVKDKAATVVIPPPPPASGPGHPPRTPLWYDINGELEPHLWKMTMGPVLGCLVMRPGVKAQNISNMIKPILGAWEALKMLKWMEEVGIVEADGEGEKACWRLRESWWMIAA